MMFDLSFFDLVQFKDGSFCHTLPPIDQSQVRKLEDGSTFIPESAIPKLTRTEAALAKFVVSALNEYMTTKEGKRLWHRVEATLPAGIRQPS